MTYRSMVFISLLLGSVGMCKEQVSIRKLPRDWQPTDMTRLRPLTVTASSFLGPNYAPERAVDNNRGTKWVATETPSESASQWLTLEFLGEQVVTGVAVFGERVDNDGILDAEVRAARTAGKFATVARIRNARSDSWLATFPPVQARTVQLLITRSGGPTTHTDVFEVMVFGHEAPPEQVRAELTRLMAPVSAQLDAATAAAKTWPPALEPIAAEVRGLLARHARELADVEAMLRKWGDLSAVQRRRLVPRITNLHSSATHLAKGLAAVPAVWMQRGKALAAARDAAKAHAKPNMVVIDRTGARARLTGRDVALDLDETGSDWEATWLDGTGAALHGARFSIDIDGQVFTLKGVIAADQPFHDKLGAGRMLVQRWQHEGVEIERRVKLYADQPRIVVEATIANRAGHDLSLGTADLLDVGPETGGWWTAGRIAQSPGVVTVAGLSQLICEPVADWGASSAAVREYSGTQVLALGHQDPDGALLIGFLSGQEARPDLDAQFGFGDGGRRLRARQHFFGRKLAAGQVLALDAVVVCARRDPFVALAQYGDAVAAFSALPPQTGATALWCSWYAHRMAMSEDLILANAAVAAKVFKPLGMEIIQLDHGWQRGDITGDWVANEKFPHGLKWLAEQLRSRYGLRLGLWIAPTDVADISATFRNHPDWMLRGPDGKPRVNWRWYWKPNPNCYELDASHPAAARFIEETFARLTSDGADYYKIDFIAGSGSEGFVQHDFTCTRGWGVLRRAMEAIRKGAGPKSWIRYCQTPPLLSVGLADSAYGGGDTLDAGSPSVFATLAPNARSLAAGYWINGRLYHREVCDMSVGMRGALWEVRMKIAMMALAGCSVSFSDELQYLPPSRIRMMQQCLPPGVPPMKPLDLFHREVPSVWDVHCRRQFADWHVVGLFNFDETAEPRTLDFAALGFAEDDAVAVFDFWEEKFLGVHKRRLTLELAARDSRIVFLHRVTGIPQVIATNLHLLGGYHDIENMKWDAKSLTLSGACRRMPGVSGNLYVYVPTGYAPRFGFPLSGNDARITHAGKDLWVKELRFRGTTLKWSVPFVRAD